MMHIHKRYIDELTTYFPQIELISGLPKTSQLFDNSLPKLLVMDDLMREINADKNIPDLFTRFSRHTNTTLVYCTQNYFDTGNSRILTRKCNVQVFFDDPLDKTYIRNISAKVVSGQSSSFLSNCLDSLRHFYKENRGESQELQLLLCFEREMSTL